jgi:hypothetical protein
MAELNQDVVTARAFPRSVANVMRNITELVMLDEQTAKECVYAVPRDGKTIRGPSIRPRRDHRLAMGQLPLRLPCRARRQDREVRRIRRHLPRSRNRPETHGARTRKNISKRDGGLYSQDMIMTAGNAAASIGMREAILKGVPKAVWRQAFEHAENVIRGDVTTLVERREDAMKALAGIGRHSGDGCSPPSASPASRRSVSTSSPTSTRCTRASRARRPTSTRSSRRSRRSGDQPAGLKGKLDQLAGDDANKKPAADKAAPKSEAGSSPAGSEQSGKQASTPKAATGNQPSSGASQAQSQPDDGDPIAKATRMGRAAYRRNMSKKAIPVDFKAEGREAERQAWLDGFAAEEDDEAAPEPGSAGGGLSHVQDLRRAMRQVDWLEAESHAGSPGWGSPRSQLLHGQGNMLDRFHDDEVALERDIADLTEHLRQTRVAICGVRRRRPFLMTARMSP